jgi:outer membrane receptor protein involved in Fe transport
MSPRRRRRRFRRGPLFALAACGVAFAAGAARAEHALIFRLPAEPVDTALVRFGIQAGVSIGGFPAPGCVGESNAVSGTLTPPQALRRLLPAGCGFRRVDAHAFRIIGARGAAGPRPPASPPQPGDLAELVVTAERRPEPLRGSPFAVSAISGADIERLGAKSFATAAAQFVGVAETNLGPGRNKILIRGISDGAFTGRTQSTVGLYLGDIPITYNAPDPDLRFADVDRVEVLRGPQGTLYGSGSIGGIVRIVPAQPDPSRTLGRLAAETTFNGHKDRSSGVEGMLNLPVLNGRAAVRGVAYYDELPGYLDNPGLGLSDTNHGHRSGVRLTGLADLDDGWQAQATVSRQSIYSDDAQYVQGTQRYVRTAALLEPHDNDFTLVGASLAHTGASVDVRASAAYIDHDRTTRYDATGAFDLPARQLAAYDDSQRTELWVAEAVATSAEAQRLRWLTGVFGSVARETSTGLLDARPSGGALRSAFARRDHLTEAAVFGEITYDLTSRLTATAGGRLFATRVETQSDSFQLARLPIPDVHRHLTDEGFAPKLRLAYAFAPDRVIYAQLQDGYRAGGFNVPAKADGRPNAGDNFPDYRPDRLHSYEIGGEAGLFGRALILRAAVFRAVWRNVQTDQFRPSGLPVTLNIGDGFNTGFEFEATWRPNRHWRARLNALLDNPDLNPDQAVFPTRMDIGLPGVAKQALSLDVAYHWTLADDLRAEISGQASYVGRSYLTFHQSAAREITDNGEGRLAASLEGRDWQVQAFVDNVTDQSGDTFAFGNPFTRSRAQQSTPLPPRSFGLAIRRTF